MADEHRSEQYRHLAEAAGRRIRTERKARRWSQQQLAKRAGVDKAQISRFERGENVEISTGRFFDICRTLDLDPVDVWYGRAFSWRRT